MTAKKIFSTAILLLFNRFVFTPNKGDYVGCLNILKPLKNNAKLEPHPLHEADAELMMPIAKATRTNSQLCGQ
ncbi:MAG: hypothetical protein Q7U57_00680 [Methylovulum sp.]|nr:hypothetical protein [Methylovulum sp.]